MESLNYSGLGNKLNRKSDSSLNKNHKLTLKEICKQLEESRLPFVDEKNIHDSYAHDLESILKLTTIESTIKDIYSLESCVNKIKAASPIDYEIPYFDEFWKSLSKTILLSLWESLENEEDTSEIIRGWYESLRISIEAELYSIQEKWGQ